MATEDSLNDMVLSAATSLGYIIHEIHDEPGDEELPRGELRLPTDNRYILILTVNHPTDRQLKRFRDRLRQVGATKDAKRYKKDRRRYEIQPYEQES